MAEKIYVPKHYIKEKEPISYWGIWVIAKREFLALLKSPRMLILGILIFLICFLASFFGTLILGGGLPGGFSLFGFQIPAIEGGPTIILTLIATMLAVAIPFMATAFTFDNISKEKESRSLALLLSKPLTKRSIALGKYLGIVAAIALPIVIVLALSTLIITLLSGDFSILGQGGKLIVFALILGASFVGIQQTISTLVKTTRTSMITGVACLLFFWVFWLLIWLGYAYSMFSSAGLAFTPENIVTGYYEYTAASLYEVGLASTPIMSFLLNNTLFTLGGGALPGLDLIPYLDLKVYLSLIGWLIIPPMVFIEVFNRLAGRE